MKTPCVGSPCSPRLSPWSAVRTTSVSSSRPCSRSQSISRPTPRSASAISASYGVAVDGGEIERAQVVGLVRVEEVHPEEERLPGLLSLLEPRQRAVRGARRRPLADHEHLRLVLRPEVVVVDLEALIEAVAAREHGGRDEGARAPARRVQALRERRRLGAERVVAVVAHAVCRWIEPGHDRGVRRQRDRGRRRGVGAADPLARQPVDRRRMGQAVAVAAEPVGPQRVDGDQRGRWDDGPHGDRREASPAPAVQRRRRLARATAS